MFAVKPSWTIIEFLINFKKISLLILNKYQIKTNY